MASQESCLGRTAAACFVLFFVVPLHANAEDICSPEGKSKMRAANVSEPQIARICPATTSQPSTSSVDYRDVREALFDSSNAKGKTISLNATLSELAMSGGRIIMRVHVDSVTDLKMWEISFDSGLNGAVKNLPPGQRLSIVCRISNLGNFSTYSTCHVIKLSAS